MKATILSRSILLLLFLLGLSKILAQPSNDNCSTATLLEVGLNAETCVPIRGDTRGTEDATLVTDAPEVCSGSWFTDDVWYSIEIGAKVPANGVTIEVRLDPSSGTELIEQGLAIYADCDSETSPFDCFSDQSGRRTILFPTTCLSPNSNFLIRLWSSPEPRENSGTFSICAYESPMDTTPVEPSPRVIYEENFADGFNGWESVSQSQSFNTILNELADNDFFWSEDGCFRTAFGTTVCLQKGPCTENSVVGIPAGFFHCQ